MNLYRNPILYGDYSDPDVIRVGKDYYMISSSFTYIPGIPVLHSTDLVHWERIGYAADHLPYERYNRPVHKCGTFAPSIRWHNGLFYVYVCLPDEGLMAFTATDPAGEWDAHLVKDVSGWIDPCPLFEPDGSAWLLHGFAASRCGINNILYLHRMSADGLQILDKGKRVYDGDEHGDVTVEGPKIYHRGEFYYILCPAGGVAHGYQLALRAKDKYGPYERKVVLQQGSTPINGPHQGGWVDTPQGENWFIHFQDVGEYGRIPHLQPVEWKNDWPEMGVGGMPVLEYTAPQTEHEMASAMTMSDDFSDGYGLQWQWQANYDPAWVGKCDKGLRLNAAPADSLMEAGQFLSQLMQYRNFDMDVRLSLNGEKGVRAGMAMMGYTCHAVALEKGRIVLSREMAEDAGRSAPISVFSERLSEKPWESESVCFRMSVREGKVQFFYGENEERLQKIGEELPLFAGGWTSARPGIYCMNTQRTWNGYAVFDDCRVKPYSADACDPNREKAT